MLPGTGTLLTVGGGAAGSTITLVAQAVGDGAGFGPGSYANLGLTGLLTMAIAGASRTVYANMRADLAEARDSARAELAVARAELKHARDELRELNGKIVNEVTPALVRSTDLTLALVRDVRDSRDR